MKLRFENCLFLDCYGWNVGSNPYEMFVVFSTSVYELDQMCFLKLGPVFKIGRWLLFGS